MENSKTTGNYIAVAKCVKCKSGLFAMNDVVSDKPEDGTLIFKKPISANAVTTNDEGDIFCAECDETESAEPIGSLTPKKNYEVQKDAIFIGRERKDTESEPKKKPERKRDEDSDGKTGFPIWGKLIVILAIIGVLIAGAFLAKELLAPGGETPSATTEPTATPTPGFTISEDDPNGKLEELALEELTKDLKIGDIGHEVEVLQAKLFVLKFYSGGIDGFFSTPVEDSVRKFQTEKGLEATGVVDQYTRIFLNGGIVVFEEKLVPADAERIKALEDEVARLKAELAKKNNGGNHNPDPTPKPTQKPTPSPTPSPSPTPTPSPSPTPTPTISVGVSLEQFKEETVNGQSFVIPRFVFSGDKSKIAQWSCRINGTLQPWSTYQGGSSVELQIDRPHSNMSVQPVIKLLDGTIIEGTAKTWVSSN